jgi:hypothetical protein
LGGLPGLLDLVCLKAANYYNEGLPLGTAAVCAVVMGGFSTAVSL